MKRAGVVTPVVFVHGAFCGGWAFDGFREPFEAAGFETHAPNLPHHERGADLEQLAQTGLKDYAKAIAHYARELRAHLCWSDTRWRSRLAARCDARSAGRAARAKRAMGRAADNA